MLIDINTEVFPLGDKARFTMALASTLYIDNRPDPGVYTDYSKEVVFGDLTNLVEDSDG